MQNDKIQHVLLDTVAQDVFASAREGNLNAFRIIVRSHQSYAFRLAMRLLIDEDEAEDVVQEAFIRVWKNIKSFDPKRKFTTWLYSIISHLCMDRLKALKRKRITYVSNEGALGNIVFANPKDLEKNFSNQEIAGIVRQLTDYLPDTQRLVFVLRDLEDLSIEEVADTTHLSIGSIKTNLHYARKTIRGMLAKQYDIEGM
jgi:RNA polymerase sigma-70 factor, ECF subfamily